MSLRMLEIPFPERIVIGHDAKLAMRSEYPMKLDEGRILHDSPFVVAGLGPGIAEVEVNGPRARIRNPVLEKLRRVSAEEADIGERVSAGAVGGVSPKLRCPLDAEKVGVPLDRSLLHEKGALAGADLDLQRELRIWEKR